MCAKSEENSIIESRRGVVIWAHNYTDCQSRKTWYLQQILYKYTLYLPTPCRAARLSWERKKKKTGKKGNRSRIYIVNKGEWIQAKWQRILEKFFFSFSTAKNQYYDRVRSRIRWAHLAIKFRHPASASLNRYPRETPEICLKKKEGNPMHPREAPAGPNIEKSGPCVVCSWADGSS